MLLALKMEEEEWRRNAGNLEKLEKFKETDSVLESPEGTQPYRHLDFRLLTPDIMGDKFVVFKPLHLWVIFYNSSRTLIQKWNYVARSGVLYPCWALMSLNQNHAYVLNKGDQWPSWCICIVILAPGWETDSERKKLKYGDQLGRKVMMGSVEAVKSSQIWDVLKGRASRTCWWLSLKECEQEKQ